MQSKIYLLFLLCITILCGCTTGKDTAAEEIRTIADASAHLTEEVQDVIPPILEEDVEEGYSFSFVDAHGEHYETRIKSISDPCLYDKNLFEYRDHRMTYADDAYTTRIGIDVSYFQGNIDWEKVKADGVAFVFIRVGFRGYGEEGTLNVDAEFHKNIQGAQAAGLDVGVYFFAQAVNEEEAVEEALFVLNELDGYELQMPVVYDPESILHTKARTDDVTKEQFTKNTLAFCRTIKEAGYEPMVYCNMLWQVFKLELSDLEEYPIWYADYEYYPQTPYHFEIWQYTSSGQIEGIEGDVDVNIQLIPK